MTLCWLFSLLPLSLAIVSNFLRIMSHFNFPKLRSSSVWQPKAEATDRRESHNEFHRSSSYFYRLQSPPPPTHAMDLSERWQSTDHRVGNKHPNDRHHLQFNPINYLDRRTTKSPPSTCKYMKKNTKKKTKTWCPSISCFSHLPRSDQLSIALRFWHGSQKQDTNFGRPFPFQPFIASGCLFVAPWPGSHQFRPSTMEARI